MAAAAEGAPGAAGPPVNNDQGRDPGAGEPRAGLGPRRAARPDPARPIDACAKADDGMPRGQRPVHRPEEGPETDGGESGRPDQQRSPKQPPERPAKPPYSHSIVPGGFDVMS